MEQYDDVLALTVVYLQLILFSAGSYKVFEDSTCRSIAEFNVADAALEMGKYCFDYKLFGKREFGIVEGISERRITEVAQLMVVFNSSRVKLKKETEVINW